MSFLTVLLTILKTAGIILAAVIVLVLVLALWLLLSPVRYKGRVRFDGKPDIKVRASYLLHIFTVRYDLGADGNEFSIRVFGHRLSGRKDKKSGTARKKQSVKTKKGGTLTEPEIRNEDMPSGGQSRPVIEPEPEKDYAYAPEEKKTESSTEDKKSVFKKVKDIYNKIIAKIKNIFCGFVMKIKSIYHKIADMADNITDKRNSLFSEINDPANRRGFEFALNLVKKLLKHVLPRKHSIFIRFGMDDPALTGELVGLIYAFALTAGLNIQVNPDFENKVFECDIPFKGRISIIRVVIWALQAYRNKDFRQLLGKIG